MAVSTQLLVGIAIIYLALILGIGYYGYKRTKSADDYMVAGRNTPPLVLALSYGATFISTSAIVGFGGHDHQQQLERKRGPLPSQF